MSGLLGKSIYINDGKVNYTLRKTGNKEKDLEPDKSTVIGTI